jgi:hypothetical protein
MDLPRRVHRLGNKDVGASVIKLPLNPVVLFLLVEPSLRERTKCPPARCSNSIIARALLHCAPLIRSHGRMPVRNGLADKPV